MPRLDNTFADQAPGQPLLLSNDPGVDAAPFLLQAAATALAAGREVVYLVTDRSPARVRRLIEKTGANVRGLTILDAHSALSGIPEAGSVSIDPGNMADVVAHIEHAVADHPNALFLLDSLNGLMMHAETKHVASTAPRLVRGMQRFPQAIAAFTHWHEEIALRPLLDSFPHNLHLSAVQHRIITSQYYRIRRLAGRSVDQPPTLYRSPDTGLVQVYVPKVVVTGPGDAGKSTFVHAVCDHAVSAERMGATVALDRGTIDRQGLHVDVFGTPGQERFDPMVAPIIANAVGVILMVDATQPASFERASYMLQRCWRQGIQVIVAANKQDLEGAMDPQAVRQRLDVPPGADVLACTATDVRSASAVIDALLDRILSPQVTV